VGPNLRNPEAPLHARGSHLILLVAFAISAANPIAAEPQRKHVPPVRAAEAAISASARAIRPGELVVLTIRTPPAIERVHARAFDHAVPCYPTSERSWRALVGIDLDVRPGAYTVAIDEAPAGGSLSYTLLVRARAFPTRTLHVDEGFVNPPPAMRGRIDAEAAALRRIWDRSAAERLWTSGFVRPVPGEANSRFGTRSVFNGQPRNPHGGADFMSPAGTPIHAPNAGRIVLARDLYFSGNTVIIDHGQGLFSLLAHLSAFAVHEGDTVTAGQTIGSVGATGRVTGPHLHWAVRLAGARIDPLSVLQLLGDR
jgi:murein DD-endopeptidase MepM/ murein hydrolase activator NlpD